MPFTLKGIDAIVFGVFQALGLKTTVKPRLQNQDYEDEDDHGHEYVGDKLYGLVTDWNSGWERDPEEERLVRILLLAYIHNLVRFLDFTRTIRRQFSS